MDKNRIRIKKQIIQVSKLLIVFAILAYSTDSMAQERPDCSNSLISANAEYEAGNFNECIELLQPCLEKFSAQQKFEAHRLLSMSYLGINDDSKARVEAINMLKLKPNYRNFPYFDPSDFAKLLAEYDIWPKFKIGIILGANFNSVRPIENFSLTSSAATFKPGAGYQIGTSGEYFLKEDLSLNLGIIVEGLSYSRESMNVSGWEQVFKENLVYLNLPLTARKYFFVQRSISIGAELGIQSQFLLKTTSNIHLDYPETNEIVQNSINQKAQRNSVVVSVLPGLVFNYKVGEAMLSANFRYGMGLTNVVNPDKRFEYRAFSYTNQYIDSDMAFNPFYISFGYQIPLRNMYSVALKK